jgi:hypothetical protein
MKLSALLVLYTHKSLKGENLLSLVWCWYTILQSLCMWMICGCLPTLRLWMLYPITNRYVLESTLCHDSYCMCLALTEMQVWNISIEFNTYSKNTQYRMNLLMESQNHLFEVGSAMIQTTSPVRDKVWIQNFRPGNC